MLMLNLTTFQMFYFQVVLFKSGFYWFIKGQVLTFICLETRIVVLGYSCSGRLGVISVLSGGAVTERLRIVHCDNVTGVHGWLNPSLAQLLECFRLPSNEPLHRRTGALLVAIYRLPSPNVTVGPAAAASSLLLGWLCRHHLGLGPVLSFPRGHTHCSGWATTALRLYTTQSRTLRCHGFFEVQPSKQSSNQFVRSVESNGTVH